MKRLAILIAIATVAMYAGSPSEAPPAHSTDNARTIVDRAFGVSPTPNRAQRRAKRGTR